MKKTTKKATKPEYIVDLATPIEDLGEIKMRFIEGKVAAGKVITTEELKSIIDYYSAKACDKCLEMNYAYLEKVAKEKNPKKVAWYKRFWKFCLRK